MTLDATVERSAEDKSQVYAKASGVVTEEKGVLRVEDALVIDGDASAEFGHVDSPLYVQIKGGIQENLEVRSAKSITVGNSVSRANASAAGSIVVRRGIIGQGTELIESGQDIIAKFASDTKLVAGGDMRIAKQLMRCEAFVGGRLLAETANVIGGSLYASKGGIVRNLGNEADLPTNIVVGICSESLQGIFVIDRRTAELRELVDKLQEIITPILDGSMDSTTEQTRRARQLSRTCRDASTRIEKDLKRREKLVHSLLTTEPVRLRVGGVVHGRVTLRIGDRVTYFHKKFQGPVTIEKQKVKNVTEVMAISQPSGATQVLKSEKRPVEALFESPEEER